MTEFELNQAIAEQLGWTWDDEQIVDPDGRLTQNRQSFDPEAGEWYDRLPIVLPKWTKDSNRMRSALCRLDDDQWLEFMLHLCDRTQHHPDLGKWTLIRVALEAQPLLLAQAYYNATINPSYKWDPLI